jgi:hypothetical protein
MKKHELKTWPDFFEAMVSGKKRFEVRKNDRDFQIGDILILKEWIPTGEFFTGREAYFYVDYILDAPKFGVRDGFVVMSLRPRTIRRTDKLLYSRPET